MRNGSGKIGSAGHSLSLNVSLSNSSLFYDTCNRLAIAKSRCVELLQILWLERQRAVSYDNTAQGQGSWAIRPAQAREESGF